MKRSIIFAWISILLLFIIVIPIVLSIVVDRIGEKNILELVDVQGTYDAVLVLGAGVYPDGRPTPMLRDRLETGRVLYMAGVAPKLLLSGDHGQVHYDEVNAMKNYMLEKGVPEEDIFLDHAGFNTYASLVRAKEVFLCEKVLVVTQTYHLTRALYIAEALGLEARGVSADARKYAGQWVRELREVGARNKAVFTVLFRPSPVLGPPIDIRGDGTLTFDEK